MHTEYFLNVIYLDNRINKPWQGCALSECSLIVRYAFRCLCSFVCWLFTAWFCFKYCSKFLSLDIYIYLFSKKTWVTGEITTQHYASKSITFVCHLLWEFDGWLKATNCIGSQHFYSAFSRVERIKWCYTCFKNAALVSKLYTIRYDTIQ